MMDRVTDMLLDNKQSIFGNMINKTLILTYFSELDNYLFKYFNYAINRNPDTLKEKKI